MKQRSATKSLYNQPTNQPTDRPTDRPTPCETKSH